ncbi:MAG: hypothetical protein J2P57_11965 [Acidimicrobiaceae bacterium]|nr:hypothetical protein [Acidimicrobiaceae bacterium]
MTTALPDLLSLLTTRVTPGPSPVWVSMHHDPEGRVTVAVEPELAGWTAPPSCIAVGAVATGRAFALEGGDPPPPGPAQVTSVMDRAGRVAARTVLGDGQVIDEAPGAGLAIDIMRRTFGLATDPPTSPSDAFISAVWLARVLDEARSDSQPRGRRLGWQAMVALHPTVEVVTLAGEEVPPAKVGWLLRVAGQAWTWSRLREQAAASDVLAAIVPRPLAAWMDEGIFSRWVLAAQPGTDALLHAVAGRVTREALRQTRLLLADTGVVRAA